MQAIQTRFPNCLSLVLILTTTATVSERCRCAPWRVTFASLTNIHEIWYSYCFLCIIIPIDVRTTTLQVSGSWVNFIYLITFRGELSSVEYKRDKKPQVSRDVTPLTQKNVLLVYIRISWVCWGGRGNDSKFARCGFECNSQSTKFFMSVKNTRFHSSFPSSRKHTALIFILVPNDLSYLLVNDGRCLDEIWVVLFKFMKINQLFLKILALKNYLKL